MTTQILHVFLSSNRLKLVLIKIKGHVELEASRNNFVRMYKTDGD